MKLSKALTKLKDLKSKVADAQRYVEHSVIQYADQEPDYDFAGELQRREQLDQEILELKTRIQLTNAATSVEYKGETMTLAQLILVNAKLRSDISFYRGLINTTISRRRSVLGEEPSQKYADDYDKKELRVTLEELESDKLEMEAALASVNLRTNLV